MYEEVRTKVQTVKVRDTQGFNQVLGKDGGQAWHQTRPRCSRSGSDLEIAKDGTSIASYYREFIKGYADKVYPMQQLMRHKGKKFTWNNAAEESFQRIKKELCKAPVLGMPTEKGMYVLDTDASIVAISGVLHQEQEGNGKTVSRPIAYESKVLSDAEMMYVASKAEMFAVVTFVKKYRAYLGNEPSSCESATGHSAG